MELKEAKQILKKAGFIIEDTDTLQDRIDADSMDIHLTRKRHDGPGYKKAIGDYADAHTRATASSVANKISNAKAFNKQTGKCIVMIYDYVNNFDFTGEPYKGFIGEADDYVETTKEAKVFDLDDMETIIETTKICLEDAIMDDINNLQCEVYIVPIKNGKFDFKAKQRMEIWN